MKTLGLGFALLFPGIAQAFCGTYIGGAGDELYNDASEIIMARQGDKTTLTLLNDYSGDLNEFAMVIPVPEVLQEENVRTVNGDFVETIRRFSEPRLVEYTCDTLPKESHPFLGCYSRDFAMSTLDGGEATEPDVDSSTVLVESEFTVGIYEIVVLSAEESGDLVEWLNTNGYAVDPTAEEVLGEYIESGAYFFAAKIDLGDQLVDGKLAPTWLEPLQFTYTSSGFSLPIRLGTLNSRGTQDLLIYTLTPYSDGSAGISNYPEVTAPKDCMLGPNQTMDEFLVADLNTGVEDNGGGAWSVEHSWTPYHCDPCTGPTLGNDVMLEMGYDMTDTPWFTRLHVKYESDITQDLMLYTTGLVEPSQSRYIQFNPDIADHFEFCDPETRYYAPAYESVCPQADPDFARKSSMWPGLPLSLAGFLAALGIGVARRRKASFSVN